MPQDTRGELEMILKKKPGFFIRWGLVIVVMIIILLFFLARYAGFNLLQVVRNQGFSG